MRITELFTKLLKRVAIIAVILTMIMFVVSHLHIRIVKDSYGTSHYSTIEFHSGKLYNDDSVSFYPYGDNHKVAVWLSF